MTLPVSRLVVVDVNLGPTPAAGRTFGDLLIMGDSNVISGLERIRDYESITDVGEDFSTTQPEYMAAEVYFDQSPPPLSLSIGRWLRTATAAMLQGQLLSSVQQMLSNFASITNGGFDIIIDGVSENLTALNFSAQTTLNGVASVIQTALQSAFSAAVLCVWDGFQFVITSSSTGTGVFAHGTITAGSNPSASDTVTISGLSIEFVSSSPSGNQVLIGGSDALTMVNLLTFCQASTNADLTQLTFSLSTNQLVLTVSSATVGTAGNSITLAKSSSSLTLSGSTLAGGANASSVAYATAGAGQDVSTLLGLTSAVALPLVPGYAAETPLAAVEALDAISTEWYGLTFAASVQPTDSQNLAIAPFIEADGITRIFGVTSQDANTLSSEVTDDLSSELMLGGYEQSFIQYSSTNPYVVASMFGRAFSVDFAGINTMLDLMYKQEPGVNPEDLTTEQANTLQVKRCNVFVEYDNDTSIIQYGVMSGPAFFDEIFGCDWTQNAMQTACFNVNYTAPTKVPQTDAGDNLYTNALSGICQQAVQNGFAAPGQWNGPAFGELKTGDYLKLGYYIYVEPIALQSESDRAARVSPPFTVALKLAGSNQTVDVLVNVNR